MPNIAFPQRVDGLRHIDGRRAADLLAAAVTAGRRYLPARESVADLLSLAYIELARADAAYDGSRGASFETYASACLRGAMRNASRALLRSETAAGRAYDADAQPLSLDDIAESVLADNGCPADSYERKTIRAMLSNALDRLPDRQIDVITLYYAYERTNAEVGRLLGISQTRAFQIRQDALAALRRRLAPYAELFR